ncbi:DRY_EERY domain-containing protein [Psidium guajava]|nr:DRY_EERY domain-containing protein [Psidium guajava]
MASSGFPYENATARYPPSFDVSVPVSAFGSACRGKKILKGNFAKNSHRRIAVELRLKGQKLHFK